MLLPARTIIYIGKSFAVVNDVPGDPELSRNHRICGVTHDAKREKAKKLWERVGVAQGKLPPLRMFWPACTSSALDNTLPLVSMSWTPALYSVEEEITIFLSKSTGQTVVHKQIPFENFKRSLLFAANIFAEVFNYCEELGYFSPDTGTLKAKLISTF
ncbi:hypothetical protein VTO42DRAFT_3852 [Malbranchea cinnamomea]